MTLSATWIISLLGVIRRNNMMITSKNVSRCLGATSSLWMTSKTIRSVIVINILAYCVGYGVIRPDPDRLQALQSTPLPENPKALERVMGMFTYYSKWLPRFSGQALPLRSSSFPSYDTARKAFESPLRTAEADILTETFSAKPRHAIELKRFSNHLRIPQVFYGQAYVTSWR